MALETLEFAVSFRGSEANLIFVEPVFTDMDLRPDFRVMPNVRTKQRLAFVTELEKIVRAYTGCGFSPVPGFQVYNRWIQVEPMKVDLEQCWDEFKDTVWEELLKTGTAISDLTGTLIMTIMERMVKTAMVKDMLRLTFFGNLADTDPAYNPVDGLWTVYIIDFVAANATPYLNTQQGTPLVAGDGIQYIKTVVDNAPLPLKSLPAAQKKIYVNGLLFEQYRADIEDAGGGDAGITLLQNGQEKFTFRGIEIVPMWSWDEIMSADFDKEDVHMILYTTPKNIVWATDVADPESQLKIWYDDKTEKVYTKARWKFGINVIHPNLMSVGY